MSKFSSFEVLLVGLAALYVSLHPATAAVTILDVAGPTGTQTEPTVRVTGDGGVFFSKGTNTSLPATVTNGAGFLWYAPKNALIISENFAASPSPAAVGVNTVSIFSKVPPTGANAIAVGVDTTYSSATGTNSLVVHAGYATNTNAIAINYGQATGFHSVAIGGYATGDHSVSLGGYAGGYGSVAFLAANATGILSIASGEWATASGYDTIALGTLSYAAGDGSTAFSGGQAHGIGSFATMGNTAMGVNAAAFGVLTTAQAFGSFVVGRSNKPEGDPIDWNDGTDGKPNDPLFVVGNGTGEWNDPVEKRYRNAFVVYKDGSIRIDKPQGDILMGVFE